MKIYYGTRNEYFEKSFGELKDALPITLEVENYSEGIKWVRNKLKEMHYTSFYFNCNFSKEKNFVEIDYGDYNYFFLFFDLSDEDWKVFYK